MGQAAELKPEAHETAQMRQMQSSHANLQAQMQMMCKTGALKAAGQQGSDAALSKL